MGRLSLGGVDVVVTRGDRESWQASDGVRKRWSERKGGVVVLEMMLPEFSSP